jgi:hypothetical protein
MYSYKVSKSVKIQIIGSFEKQDSYPVEKVKKILSTILMPKFYLLSARDKEKTTANVFQFKI